MLPLVFIALVILVPSLTTGQSPKQEWSPDELYNPLVEPRKCGLPSDEPGYICDPNGILGDHLQSFNWILKDAAYNSTRCPCSNFYCETETGARGYRIAVAIVKRMKIQTNIDGRHNSPEDQSQLFAYRLENTRWNMGQCEEDIVIFYSADDKMLAMYGGSTAMAKLTPYYRELLAYKSGSRFNDGRIVEALNMLLYDLKLVLNCDSDEHDCNIHEYRGSGSGSLSSCLGIVSLAVGLSLFTALRS